jgi:hypothetical protein
MRSSRLPRISKYCVVRALGALASSKVYAIEVPSIGICSIPLTLAGGTIPTAS